MVIKAHPFKAIDTRHFECLHQKIYFKIYHSPARNEIAHHVA